MRRGGALALAFALGCGGTGGTEAGEGSASGSSETTGGDGRACSERVDEADCAAGNAGQGPGNCEWRLAHPTVREADVCTFGEPVGVCIGNVAYGDGCAPDPWGCDMGQPSILFRASGDRIELMSYVASCSHLSGGGFQTCPFGDEEATTGDDADVVPVECLCGCDPAWPGG